MMLKHYKDLKHNSKYSSSKDIDFMDLYEWVNFRFIAKKETTPLEAFAVIKIVCVSNPHKNAFLPRVLQV